MVHKKQGDIVCYDKGRLEHNKHAHKKGCEEGIKWKDYKGRGGRGTHGEGREGGGV